MDTVQDNKLQHILHSDSWSGVGSGHNCRGEGFLGACEERHRFSWAPPWWEAGVAGWAGSLRDRRQHPQPSHQSASLLVLVMHQLQHCMGIRSTSSDLGISETCQEHHEGMHTKDRRKLNKIKSRGDLNAPNANKQKWEMLLPSPKAEQMSAERWNWAAAEQARMGLPGTMVKEGKTTKPWARCPLPGCLAGPCPCREGWGWAACTPRANHLRPLGSVYCLVKRRW